MKCSYCGKTNNEQNQFCSECGSNLLEQNTGKTWKHSERWAIVLATTIIGLTAGLAIFYQIGKANFAPENLVQNFEEAVENNDPDEIQNLLISSNKSLSINHDNTSKLVEFLKKNPEAFKNLIQKLSEQAKVLKSDVTAQETDEVYGTLNLTKDGKQWLFFDNYKLEVIPMDIKLESETDGIDLFINDEKVAASSKRKIFGPYMPGNHVVKAEFENEYTSTETTDEIEIFNSQEDTLMHEIELPLGDVSIISLHDEYKLFVNGEQTDIVINEGENPIGTFPTDSSTAVYIQKEFPWGTAKSEEKPVTSDIVEFDEIDVFKKDETTALMEQINESISKYHEALTKKDESIVQTGVTDNLNKILSEHLEFTGDWNEPYEGELKKAIYDKSKISYPEYNEDLEGYTITLKAHYHLYEPHGHAYGNLNWQGRDQEKQQYMERKKLTLYYDEGESAWMLHSIENEYFHIAEKNKKEFTLE
ncbi:zinc ribbon domain-containing protein [Lentibacillus salicampi]|uniref:Zinc ribbon domain-containing protein n=1 Tax=Lentibacillus salicampi TaxID=175306 RepID=A0A4Y9A7U6_9BACI|nr:hypothetical protein [Lentibacillus salicampi]TFJ91282.1 hypothetical protein E4U82_18490 [Lentibacillus salicampi]